MVMERTGTHGSLRNLCSTREDDSIRTSVDSLDLDEALTVGGHSDVTKTNLHLAIWQTHCSKVDLVSYDASADILSSDLLNESTRASGRVHAVSDGAGE